MERSEIARLVGRSKEGDQQAKADLCALTYDAGYFLAYKIVHSRDDALDIVQDAYVKAFLNLEQLEKEESFVSWFNCIVSNRAKDYVKKRKPTLFVEMRGPEDEAEVDFADDDLAFRPDEKLDYDETQRLVEAMVDSLPEDQRLCVLMYYYDELPVAQIAQALELSENTVKSRLNYARKKIRAQVVELEKKEGVKLYSAAPIPLFAFLLRRVAAANGLPVEAASLLVGQVLEQSAVASASAVAADTAAEAAGQAVQAPAAAEQALPDIVAKAGKVAAKGMSTKTMIGIAAGLTLVAGIFTYLTLLELFQDSNPPQPVMITVSLPSPQEMEAAKIEAETNDPAANGVAGAMGAAGQLCIDGTEPINPDMEGTFSYTIGGVNFELPVAWAGYIAFLEQSGQEGVEQATAFYVPCNTVYTEGDDGRSLLFRLEAVPLNASSAGTGGIIVAHNGDSAIIYTSAASFTPEADRTGLSDNYHVISAEADALFAAMAADGGALAPEILFDKFS